MSHSLAAIDAQIHARHLLTHPFYQTWTAGTLSREALQDYACQYYQHVAAFPTYLSAVHSHTADQAARRQLLANLIDEEAGDPNHPQLWLDFAASLGMAPEEVQTTTPWEETRRLIETFQDICRNGSCAEGIGALYAYESQIPAVAEAKIEGLRRFYGVTAAQEYRYFTVHVEADQEHAAAERALLEGYLNPANAADVSAAVARVLDALWEMLSGVCRRHGMAA